MKVGVVTSKPSETNPNGKLFQMIGVNPRTGATFKIIISNVNVSGTPGEKVIIDGEQKVISRVEYKNGTTTYFLSDGSKTDKVEFITRKINPKEGETYFFEESQGYAKLIKPFHSGSYWLKKIERNEKLTKEELEALRVNAFLESKSSKFISDKDQVVFENGTTVPLKEIVSRKKK